MHPRLLFRRVYRRVHTTRSFCNRRTSVRVRVHAWASVFRTVVEEVPLEERGYGTLYSRFLSSTFELYIYIYLSSPLGRIIKALFVCDFIPDWMLLWRGRRKIVSKFDGFVIGRKSSTSAFFSRMREGILIAINLQVGSKFLWRNLVTRIRFLLSPKMIKINPIDFNYFISFKLYIE